MDPEQYGLYRSLTDLREPYRWSSLPAPLLLLLASMLQICNSVILPTVQHLVIKNI